MREGLGQARLGAAIQPIRQPVIANVFESAFIVMVRSRSPGSAAGLRCFVPSNTKCS